MSSVAKVGHRPRWPIHSLVESFKATLKIVMSLASICLNASIQNSLGKTIAACQD